MIHMKPVGTKWRHARAQLDLSSKEAAERLGIEQRSLLNIESGQERATVSERLAYRAERLYGVPFAELVDGSSEGTPDEPTTGKAGPKRLRGAA